MKKLKIVGIFTVCLLVFSLFTVCSMGITYANSNFSAKDKLPVLLKDVIGLDLLKYSITDERYKPRYEYGGAVEVEYCGFTLVDENGGKLSVQSEFYNGFPEWVNIRKNGGLWHYAIEPPKNSVAKMENILERYANFAQKYSIDTLDTSVAFNLLSKAPSNLPSGGVTANVSSEDMTLFIAQNRFSFGYTVNGVNIPNRSWSIVFSNDFITFHDTFGLYSVCSVNVFPSKEAFTSFAFDVAEVFCGSFFVTAGEGFVRPELLRSRFDVGLLMIPEQMYNNPLNNELLEKGLGTSYSVKRDALTLYPLWTAIFYFSTPVGNVDGVQVGVWGDTDEVAYCWETGHLGGSQYSSDGLSHSKSTNYSNMNSH